MSRERCINARPDEIRSYLAGTLTEVRRPVMGIPPEAAFPAEETDFSKLRGSRGDLVFNLLDEDGRACYGEAIGLLMQGAISCPFGRPGDALVFRETWAAHPAHDHQGPQEFGPYGALLWYREQTPNRRGTPGRWRSAATMPKWAARIRITIASVRAERVGDGWEWVIGLEAP